MISFPSLCLLRLIKLSYFIQNKVKHSGDYNFPKLKVTFYLNYLYLKGTIKFDEIVSPCKVRLILCDCTFNARSFLLVSPPPASLLGGSSQCHGVQPRLLPSASRRPRRDVPQGAGRGAGPMPVRPLAARRLPQGSIFRTLFSFISFGVNQDGGPSALDPPEHLFRIRLVCTVLDTCGQYFDRGSSKRKLDCFLIYFQVRRLPLRLVMCFLLYFPLYFSTVLPNELPTVLPILLPTVLPT